MKFYKAVIRDPERGVYRSLYNANPQVYEVGKEVVCDNMFLYSESDRMGEYLDGCKESAVRYLLEIETDRPYVVKVITSHLLSAIDGMCDYRAALRRAITHDEAWDNWARNIWMCDKLVVVRVLEDEEASQIAQGAQNEINA